MLSKFFVVLFSLVVPETSPSVYQVVQKFYTRLILCLFKFHNISIIGNRIRIYTFQHILISIHHESLNITMKNLPALTLLSLLNPLKLGLLRIL